MNKGCVNFFIGLIGGSAILLLLLQLIPYGRAHHNPPILQEPPWDSPQTRQLFVRACFDCHSNETHWPWYSHLAPFSWIVHQDVDEGREEVNFSEWGSVEYNTALIYKSVNDGEMPLKNYMLTHPEARFTPEETQALLDGIRATFGVEEIEE